MVQDMLRRFIGSAILTVPIVLYSPLGTSLFGRELAPPIGLSPGLLSFVLTSVVVWWGAWPFVSSAARSLQQLAKKRIQRRRSSFWKSCWNAPRGKRSNTFKLAHITTWYG